MHLAEAPDPRQTQPRHFSGFAHKGLEVLSEMPRPFFDTKEESTIYALKHMPKSDGRPRYDGKVPHLVGFSSSLYGKLDGQFLELMIGMLEFSTHLMREVPK